MSDTWVNIYLWALIGLSVVGIFFTLFRPLSRFLGKPKSNDKYIKAIKRRLLMMECFQFITGVIGLVLFKRGIFRDWALLSFCTVLQISGLFLIIKAVDSPVE